MKEKVAILGYTKEEASRYRLFELYNIEDAECISINHSNFLAHNDFDNYIDHKILHEDIAVLPKQIAYTWYRNDQYIDNYKNQFSVGIAMQTKVAALISYNLKYYFAFKQLLKKYTLVVLPENISHDLLIIIKLLKANTIIHNAFSEDVNRLNQISQSLGRITKYPINKYSPYMYKIQKFFSLVGHKKTLVFTDWTYKHYRSNSFLYQNSKNIFNGFYTKNQSNNISRFISTFPKYIDVNNSKLNKINERVMNNVDKNNLSCLFKEVISHEYKSSLENLCRSYLTIKDIFVNYKPKQFVCATINHPWHTIMAELSREMNISSIVILDGYATFLDKLYYPKDSNNEKYLFDNHTFSGSLAKELSNELFPEVKGNLIKFPISDLISKKIKIANERYDALVMMLYPRYENPNSHFDQKFKYILDIIKILKRNNYKRIVIKFKHAHKNVAMYENMFIKDLLLSKNLADLEIYEGSLHDIIYDAGFIVGQAGTALIESNIANIPFYIYEPIYNGLSDNDIERSIFKHTHYARTLAELETNIVMRRDSILNRNKLVDGSTMTDILN